VTCGAAGTGGGIKLGTEVTELVIRAGSDFRTLEGAVVVGLGKAEGDAYIGEQAFA